MKPPDAKPDSLGFVDFLVATALKDEYDAVGAFLPDAGSEGIDTICSVRRAASPDSYSICVIVTRQTNALAESAVKEAINRLRPRAVIFAGIAAGFPEAGVSLGDILIPFRIFQYEYAKIVEHPAGPTPSSSKL
jgi:nucleoside phosphorylase